jgi:hypothetical protein
MGAKVAIPMSIQGVMFRTLQKMSAAINDNAQVIVQATGSIVGSNGATGNTGTFEVEDTFEIDTGYVPTGEQRDKSVWRAKVININGTFNGTDPEIFFDCIPIISPQNSTVKILARLYAKNLTSYSNLSGTWVLQEIK